MTTTTTMAAAGADPRSAIAPITCDTTGTREKALASLLEQIMDSYSVSDDEKPLADAVEAFLRSKPHLTVHRHGDTVVASTSLGRPRRVVLAGHLDTVPVIDNFPPRWLTPGDPLIREDVAAAHPGERVMRGRAYQYRPAFTRSRASAEAMREILQGAGDREAALLHFVTSVSDAESELLRSALERRDRRK